MVATSNRWGRGVVGSAVHTGRSPPASVDCRVFEIDLPAALVAIPTIREPVKRSAAGRIPNDGPVSFCPANHKLRCIGPQICTDDPSIVRSARGRGKRRIMLDNRVLPDPPDSGTLLDVPAKGEGAVDDENAVPVFGGTLDRSKRSSARVLRATRV